MFRLTSNPTRKKWNRSGQVNYPTRPDPFGALNLGVKKGLKIISNSVVKARKIMTMIKNSTRHCDSLRAFCTLKRIKYLKPILDVETRWNLTFYMLKRFKVLKPALLLLAADNCSINDLYPDINDWNSIEVSC